MKSGNTTHCNVLLALCASLEGTVVGGRVSTSACEVLSPNVCASGATVVVVVVVVVVVSSAARRAQYATSPRSTLRSSSNCAHDSAMHKKKTRIYWRTQTTFIHYTGGAACSHRNRTTGRLSGHFPAGTHEAARAPSAKSSPWTMSRGV